MLALIFICASMYTLFILTAFKGGIEPDYYSYRDVFYNAPNLSSMTFHSLKKSIDASYGIEPGIVIISSFFKFFGFGYQALIIFFSLINIALIFFACKYLDLSIRYLSLSILFLVFYQSFFVQIRFSSGVFLTLLACFSYLCERKKSAILFFITGLTIHNISSLFLFIIPALKITRKALNWHWVILFCALLVSYVDFIYVFKFISEYFFPRYAVYFTPLESVNNNKILFYWRWIVYCLLFGIIFFKEWYISKPKDVYEEFFKFCLFMNLFSWSIGYELPIFYRVSWFFDVGLLYFVLAASRSKYLIKRIIIISFLISLLLYRVIVAVSDFSAYRFDWYTG